MSNTSNVDLMKIAKKQKIPLINIAFKDQLNRAPIYTGGYIINMSNSEEMDGRPLYGTHWVCVYVDNANAVYFDSFGVLPSKQVIEFIKLRFSNYYVMNRQIQNTNSGFCGIYCLYFIKYMWQNRKKPFEWRLERFYDKFDLRDVEKNKEILKKLMKIK